MLTTASQSPGSDAVVSVADTASAEALACCSVAGAVPWLRLAIGVFVAAQTMTFGLAINITPPEEGSTRVILHLAMLGATGLVGVLIGWPLAREVARELAARRLTTELFFLAGIAGAMGISIHSVVRGRGPVYFETVNVLLIVYAIGHAISAGSRQRAVAALDALTSPLATARRITGRVGSGEEIVDARQILPGECVRVLPGELIPVDGRVIEGHAMVRQTPFTGEWISCVRGPGEAVLAGTACEDGTLLIEATAPGSDRSIDRLVRLIESARQAPTSLQRQADRLVRLLLPVVLLLCGGTFAYWTYRANWHTGLLNALAVLLVACPCAAGLAAPLGIWSAIAGLARRGLIVRSGDAVERLAQIDGVVFDKTGTLSDDRMSIRSIATGEDPADRALALAVIAAMERCSTHPVARALREIPQAVDAPAVEASSIRVLSGRGIEGEVRIAEEVAHTARITRDERAVVAGVLRVSLELDGRWMASVTLAESFRSSAPSAIESLRKLGLPVRIMTGDTAAGAAAASELAPTAAEMSPQQKHAAVGRLGVDADAPMRRPLFVGDGINDAAAMAAAHMSIALAGGSPVTLETAGAVLRGDDLELIADAVALSRNTVRVIRSNFSWGVVYNSVGIALAAGGLLHPVVASVLMAMSSMLVAWRSFRASGLDRTSAEVVAGSVEVRNERRGRIREPAGRDGTRPSVVLAHWIGAIGQGVVLAFVAGLSITQSLVLLVPFVVLAWWIARPRASISPFWDMTWGMISLGGLGMNMGWWADAGFGPALQHSCCAPTAAASIAAAPCMYLGMIAVGVPAMFVLRRAPEVFSWRRWCCTGMLVLGVPGMIFGMWAGSRLTAILVPNIPPTWFTLLHYVFMMLGMTAGMAVPHALERILPTVAARQ